MSHLVLLGDSVFDNGPYVDQGRDLCSQLGKELGTGWQVSLLAVDGSVVADVERQAHQLPGDATHLLVSAGGNDALMSQWVLSRPTSNVAEALVTVAEVVAAFRTTYHAMLADLLKTGLPVTVCTIYEPFLAEPVMQTASHCGVSLFNDAIIREAIQTGVPVLDLRCVFTEAGDFTHEIEPSAEGGAKLASAIADMLRASPDGLTERRACIWC